MKPFSIFLSVVLALTALAFIAWIGQKPFGKSSPTTEQKPEPTEEDLPLPASGPYGKAEIGETEFNFGVRMVQDRGEHTFTIKNGGEGILAFKLGKPTCQCTVGEITKAGKVIVKDGEVIEESPLAPGESIDVLVKWKMDSAMERFRQVVPVFTTDPDERKIQLIITGAVDSPLHIKPEGIWNLGEISTSEQTWFEGFVASRVLREFELSEVPRDNSHVKLTWKPAAPDDLVPYSAKSGYTIRAEVGPDVPIGILRESIKLKAVYGEHTLLSEISVTGRRSGPIEVRGVIGTTAGYASNKLVFRDFLAAQGEKATLSFYVKELDEELVLKSVEPAGTPIKVRMLGPGKPFGKSMKYDIEVEIPPGPVANHRGDNAESINLKFNHPNAPDFNLIVEYNAVRRLKD